MKEYCEILDRKAEKNAAEGANGEQLAEEKTE